MWFKVQATDLTFKNPDNAATLRHDSDGNSVKLNNDTLAVYTTDQEAIDALNGLMQSLGYVELVGTA